MGFGGGGSGSSLPDHTHTNAAEDGGELKAATTLIDGSVMNTVMAFLGLNNIWTANQIFNDNVKLLLGTGSDAALYYDTTNLVIDPKEVGAGQVDLNDADLGNIKFIQQKNEGQNDIATGTYTPSGSVDLINTEASAPTDTVTNKIPTDTIGGRHWYGQSRTSSQDPTINDGTPAALSGNFTFDSAQDALHLMTGHQSVNDLYQEFSRSDNA